MSKKYGKLKDLLKELFQLDKPDLDFGLYRVMYAKSDEVSRFLDNDLLSQVQDALTLYQSADKAQIKKYLGKAMDQETMENLFGCAVRATHGGDDTAVMPAAVTQCSDEESQRRPKTAVSRSLEGRLAQRIKTETLFTIR